MNTIFWKLSVKFRFLGARLELPKGKIIAIGRVFDSLQIHKLFPFVKNIYTTSNIANNFSKVDCRNTGHVMSDVTTRKPIGEVSIRSMSIFSLIELFYFEKS